MVLRKANKGKVMHGEHGFYAGGAKQGEKPGLVIQIIASGQPVEIKFAFVVQAQSGRKGEVGRELPKAVHYPGPVFEILRDMRHGWGYPPPVEIVEFELPCIQALHPSIQAAQIAGNSGIHAAHGYGIDQDLLPLRH
jgi:hypothetical protein